MDQRGLPIGATFPRSFALPWDSMSFLPPTGTPFSLVEQFPTSTQLNAAIQAGIASGAFINAPPGGEIAAPDRTLIVGGGNQVTVFSTDPPADILITGLGTRLNLLGPADVQGTNLGGGGLIIETLGGDSVGSNIPDFSPKRIDVSSSFSDVNAIVNTSELVGGNLTYNPQQTILEASGGLATDINFYVHGGAGDDLLIGSAGRDFLRGGAGNDAINAGAGNDIVRGGAGSDNIELGSGQDILYYTIDQIDNSEDFIADYTANEDTLYFDFPDIQREDVTIISANVVEVKVDDRTLRIISGKDGFQQSDIDFI